MQEFKGDQIKVEQFLNTDAIRLGWRVISIQKVRSWYLFGADEWLVTYEKDEKKC
jgi:hypothetical protein